MSTATYIYGTVEYLMVKLECETPGITFTPSEWTAKMTLVAIDEVFDDDAAPSIWTDAVLETVGTDHYAKILLGSAPIKTAGTYRALIRLTKTVGGTEVPLLKASGLVRVEEG